MEHRLTVEFAGGVCVDVPVSPDLVNNDELTGTVLQIAISVKYPKFCLPDLEEKDSKPLVEFLKTGKYGRRHDPMLFAYAADTETVAMEIQCYKAAHGHTHIPGLLRDIEDSVCSAVMAMGAAHIDVVYPMVQGYDRLVSACDTLRRVLPTTTGVTYSGLREKLESEYGLYFFYGENRMMAVFDMGNADRREADEQFAFEWMATTGRLREVTTVPGKRYLTYIAARGPCTVVPSSLLAGISDPEGLMEKHAKVEWKQVGADVDFPVFPPLHSIDAVIGTSIGTGIGKMEFVYTRNDLWSFAYFDKVEEDRATGHTCYRLRQ